MKAPSKFKVGDEIVCSCLFKTCSKLFRIKRIESDGLIEATSLVGGNPAQWHEADYYMIELKVITESPLFKALS